MRDIAKAVADYKRIIAGQEDKFFLTDLTQIYDLARKPDTGEVDTFTAIGVALDAGFAIGYKYAKRDNKRGKK